VTNADYARFLAASGYRPKHTHGFLRHWLGGAVPAGLGNHRVVQVDLDDARAYAAWAGKRCNSGRSGGTPRGCLSAGRVTGRVLGHVRECVGIDGK
jgi:hypothetical protein